MLQYWGKCYILHTIFLLIFFSSLLKLILQLQEFLVNCLDSIFAITYPYIFKSNSIYLTKKEASFNLFLPFNFKFNSSNPSKKNATITLAMLFLYS